MAYIGSTPTSQNFISGTDYFNGTGSQTAFTLTRSVNSVNDVEVVVNNVIQQPSSYTVSGTTLTLSAAPSSGTSNVYVRYLATNQQSFTVGNNTVGYNQLTSDMQSKFAMKNRIINGAMVISQRNGTSSVTPANGAVTYTIDRWNFYVTQASKLTTQQSSTAPTGFTKSMLVTSSSAYSVTSTDRFQFTQPIEGYNIADLGWGTPSAKTVTLSFQVYSSLTGTFGGAIKNSTGARSYPFTYSIPVANTWTTISVTIAGDTTGTWNTDNTGGILVTFGLGVGATYSGTAGAWASANYDSTTGATSVVGTSGATFYITGVQLEVGSSATGFEYRQYGTELQLCQRYYQICKTAVGAGNTSTAVALTLAFRVDMRTGPTIAQQGVMVVSDGANDTTQSSTGLSGLVANTDSYILLLNNFSGLTVNRPYIIRLSNNNGFTMSAEL